MSSWQSTAGRVYAAHCGGSGPDRGRMDAQPVDEGRHLDAGVRGEVRDQRARRRFSTLATIRAGSPVAIALTITAAYSPLRSISNGSPASSRRFVSAYSSRLFATRVEVLADRDVEPLDLVPWG